MSDSSFRNCRSASLFAAREHFAFHATAADGRAAALSHLFGGMRLSVLPGDVSLPALLDWSVETCLLRLPRTRCPAHPGPRLQGCAGRRDGWTCASFRCCTPACRSTPRGPTPAGKQRDCSLTLRLFWQILFGLFVAWCQVPLKLQCFSHCQHIIPQHGRCLLVFQFS